MLLFFHSQTAKHILNMHYYYEYYYELHYYILLVSFKFIGRSM